MTELFGRLAPGQRCNRPTLNSTPSTPPWSASIRADYAPNGDNRIHAVLLRDQITSGAKTILWVLLASSVLSS